MNPDKYRKRLEKKDTKQLKSKATEFFNKFIRERDSGKPCISCGNFRELQAGHYYAAGKVRSLKYHEDNVHGQCLKCNYYEHANLLSYRESLIKKIGKPRLTNLDVMAGMEKQAGHYKRDRFTLIEIIMKYKQLIDEFNR